MPSFLNSEETARIADCIELNLAKNEEMRALFKERVGEDLAEDYRCYVAQEAYLDLVLERLRNSYYRSREAFFGDLTQIVTASEIYNGDDDELTAKAKTLIDKLKKELRQLLDQKSKPKTPPRESISRQARVVPTERKVVSVNEETTSEGVVLTFNAMVPQNHHVTVLKKDDDDISLMIDQRAIASDIQAATIEEWPQNTRVGNKRTSTQANAKLV